MTHVEQGLPTSVLSAVAPAAGIGDGAQQTGVTSSSLFTWGCGSHGQLGTSLPTSTATPATATATDSATTGIRATPGTCSCVPVLVEDVSGPSHAITCISCGGGHMSALIDGQVFSWGGLYAIGGPEWLVFGASETTSVSCGALNTWAMSPSCRCICRWRLDAPCATDPSHVVRVAVLKPTRFYPDKEPVQISAGALHTLVVFKNGELHAIGSNEMGQLGVGDCKERFEFTGCIFEPGVRITFVAAGGKHSLAVSDTGQLYSWGSGIQGQLGHGDECSHATPQVVSYFNGTRLTRVACGDKHSLVTTDTGLLFTFGENKRGQLGTGDNINCNLPRAVVSLKSERISQIAAGGAYGSAHSLALTETNILFAWGSNDQGQLGLGDRCDRNTPTVITFLSSKKIKNIACGWLASACVVEEDIGLPTPSFTSRRITSLVSLGNFSVFPIDVLLTIIGFLDYEALCSVSQACRSLFCVASDDQIWQALYQRENWDPRIKKAMISVQIGPLGDWKQIFRTALRESKKLSKTSFGSNQAMEIMKKVKIASVAPPENASLWGSLLSKTLSWVPKIFSSQAENRILMHGLDAAGKTTITYRLKLEPDTSVVPQIGFCVEYVKYKNWNMVIWDVGGEDKIRALWKHYYQNTVAYIWVVDSEDQDRMEECRHHLATVAHEELLRGVPILIFTNKQDLPHALCVYEVAQRLELNKIFGHSHPLWYIQGCCAISGDGLIEGFQWLFAALASR
ncbi:ADPribosylation factor subfamily protein [Pelomyxa schiedti]|nr:ADPribosylation factor subfamily protein [Pelomyxa schiedti]